MTQEEKEKLLEATHLPKEVWDSCIITDDGQIFTPNDETEETAEEVYNKHLSNIGKETPSKMEVLEEEVSGLRQENKLLKAQVEALSQTSDFREELIVEMANKVYA